MISGTPRHIKVFTCKMAKYARRKCPLKRGAPLIKGPLKRGTTVYIFKTYSFLNLNICLYYQYSTCIIN